MMPALWPVLLAAALSAASGAGLAWRIAGDRAAARLAECEQAGAEERRQHQDTLLTHYRRADAQEAAAARRLAEQARASERTLKETRAHVYALTTGRDCLPGPVRLRLNAALDPGPDLPVAAGPAADAAAAPADDTAVALWIADAIERYDACRARIDALRDWHAALTQEPL